ncbi:MAG: rhodanese-like domain-containing protein [Opitutaceae bacterium]|nr:rhodanese-like domain-containing protein [Opitutaceae bacterium]
MKSPTAISFGWRVFRESVLLIFFAALVALAVGTLHPRHPDWRLPYPAKTSIDRLRSLQEHVLWVDARSPTAYAGAHLPGAVLLNEDQWNTLLPAFLERWQPGCLIVVYCDVRNGPNSMVVARRLQRELQIREIKILKEGRDEWLSETK